METYHVPSLWTCILGLIGTMGGHGKENVIYPMPQFPWLQAENNVITSNTDCITSMFQALHVCTFTEFQLNSHAVDTVVLHLIGVLHLSRFLSLSGPICKIGVIMAPATLRCYEDSWFRLEFLKILVEYLKEKRIYVTLLNKRIEKLVDKMNGYGDGYTRGVSGSRSSGQHLLKVRVEYRQSDSRITPCDYVAFTGWFNMLPKPLGKDSTIYISFQCFLPETFLMMMMCWMVSTWIFIHYFLQVWKPWFLPCNGSKSQPYVYTVLSPISSPLLF